MTTITRRVAHIAALATLAVVGCRSRAASDNTSATSTAGAPASLALRLERGPCFGRCPEYVVELFSDGAVRFEGRKNVKSLGEQRANVLAADVLALQRRLLDAGFSKADSAYVGGSPNCGRYFTDGPQLILSAPVGAAIKSVHVEAGCTGSPRYLTTLAAQVDSVARTSAWIAGNGETK
ncbi:MAG: DUF6438 domain-containing protein [Gemmatimonas sp.]